MKRDDEARRARRHAAKRQRRAAAQEAAAYAVRLAEDSGRGRPVPSHGSGGGEMSGGRMPSRR